MLTGSGYRRVILAANTYNKYVLIYHLCIDNSLALLTGKYINKIIIHQPVLKISPDTAFFTGKTDYILTTTAKRGSILLPLERLSRPR